MIPASTTKGPPRTQIMVLFNEKDGQIPTIDGGFVVRGMNDILQRAGSELRVLSGSQAYGGWSLRTTDVPNERDLNAARGWITQVLPAWSRNLWVGLPQSTSYLAIHGVPKYKVGGNLTVYSDIDSAFEASPLSEHYIPTARPRVINSESKSSTSVTVYFNIWDSQAGTRAKALNNKTINILGRKCLIRSTPRQPGVPFCKNCCKWGHPDFMCRTRRRCPICGESHTRDEHRHHASCCKGKPKQLPKPIPPTAEEIKVCPHRVRCLNCRKEGHDAESSKCPFWYARFNRTQINALNKQVRDRQDHGWLQSNPVLPNV